MPDILTNLKRFEVVYRAEAKINDVFGKDNLNRQNFFSPLKEEP